MARKKTTEKEPTTISKEPKIENVTDKLSYVGSIKVKIMKGNKVIKQQKFFNSGRWPIFKQLAYSLAGQYVEADAERPLFLEIFSIPYANTAPNPGQETPAGNKPKIEDNTASLDEYSGNFDSGDIRKYANLANRKTLLPATYFTRPEVTIKENAGIGSAFIKYSFSVPFYNLQLENLSAEDGWKKYSGYEITPLNLVALYSKNSKRQDEIANQSWYSGNPSAFFFVTQTDSSKLSSLLPKNITSTLGDYSLLIEWTLKLC